MSMPRYLGVSCRCGGDLRYYDHAVNGMAALHCNKCGWMQTTNEPWDESRHGRIKEKKPGFWDEWFEHPIGCTLAIFYAIFWISVIVWGVIAIFG